jgi:hypothetical protein
MCTDVLLLNLGDQIISASLGIRGNIICDVYYFVLFMYYI